jgi:hypothetical protein
MYECNHSTEEKDWFIHYSFESCLVNGMLYFSLKHGDFFFENIDTEETSKLNTLVNIN